MVVKESDNSVGPQTFVWKFAWPNHWICSVNVSHTKDIIISWRHTHVSPETSQNDH